MTLHDPEKTLRALIDDNLRLLFQDKIEEELPDRFKILLAQLQAAEKRREADDPA